MTNSPRKGPRPLLSAVSGGIVLLSVAALQAQVIGGGGPKNTDCWMTFASVPAANKPAARPSRVECADQDVACGDANPALGYCTFDVQMAFNSTSGFPFCAPTSAPATGFRIPYSGPGNDDHPKHVDDFEPLLAFAEDQLPLSASQTDRLSGFKPVTVPLAIVTTASGPRFRASTVKLEPLLCAAGLLSTGKCPPGVDRDADSFKLVCTIPKDPVTKAKISPCTGIASTFQQIQEHIFDRKCSNQATCHGSTDPAHDLCLKPSCGGRSAYTDLVGVDPHNLLAADDGLKRVVPGDLSGSLLYRKIKGGSLLNSPAAGLSAYGFRMPYHNPTADRARPKLSQGEIRLIENWILAGAPQTGFINSPGACQ